MLVSDGIRHVRPAGEHGHGHGHGGHRACRARVGPEDVHAVQVHPSKHTNELPARIDVVHDMHTRQRPGLGLNVDTQLNKRTYDINVYSVA